MIGITLEMKTVFCVLLLAECKICIIHQFIYVLDYLFS